MHVHRGSAYLGGLATRNPDERWCGAAKRESRYDGGQGKALNHMSSPFQNGHHCPLQAITSKTPGDAADDHAAWNDRGICRVRVLKTEFIIKQILYLEPADQ